MSYETMATSRTPALVIYLLDISGSMSQPLSRKRRIDIVVDALTATLRQMVFRSTKGGSLSPRYCIGLVAYSDYVYDLLDGVKTVDQVVQLGVPELSPMRTTETAKSLPESYRDMMLESNYHVAPGTAQGCPAAATIAVERR